jgi:hypothetical protein
MGLGAAQAQDNASPYPNMAPLTSYTIADRGAEIAMARSAAPPSISNYAEIRVLGAKGYETAVQGKNGFVCLVERSWAKDTTDPEFWNPKMRAPTCFNDVSVRSYLPLTMKKTEWVLAGLSREQIAAKLKSGFENGEFTAPPNGAIAYMMSKAGYLSDRDRHWHPHVMFYVPMQDPSQLGANADNSPVFGVQDAEQHFDVLFIPVDHWSDDSPDSTQNH